MCDSCVQPAVSSILKRSIKKGLMAVQLVTAQGGEQGRVNRRTETYITGIEVSKWSVVGRKSIVTSHKAHLSFAAESSTAVSLPGQQGSGLWTEGLADKGDTYMAWSVCRQNCYPSYWLLLCISWSTRQTLKLTVTMWVMFYKSIF